jgi:hypothetical protein
VDVQLDAELAAQRGAVRLVVRGVVAQTVVAVQGRDASRAREAHGDVEQAHGVAPAGEEDEHRLAGGQEAACADPWEEVHGRRRYRDAAARRGRLA